MTRLVVVGNGMVGARFVEDLLAADDLGRFQVTVLGAEACEPYNRVLLSEVVSGAHDLGSLALPSPRHARLRVHRGDAVAWLDREDRVVGTRGGRRTRYDLLVLATGARARVPELPGLGPELPAGVHPLRTIDDAREIVAATLNARSAVVLGAGVLGLEAASGLARRGLSVTVVHPAPGLMDRQLDADASRVVETAMTRMGIAQRVGVGAAAALVRDDRLHGLRLTSGEVLLADLLVVAAGTVPDTDLAASAGLRTDRGIVVDAQLATSDRRVHAIGDCAQPPEGSTGLVAQGWDQARQLAAHLTGSGQPARTTDTCPADVVRLKASGLDVVTMGVCGSRREDDPRRRTVRLTDPDRGRHVEVVVSDERLVGATCVGAPDVAADLVAAYTRRTPVPVDPAYLLLPALPSRAGAAGTEPASLAAHATVCRCNGVSKADIVAGHAAGATTAEAVATATRATTGCGGCLEEVCRLLDWLDGTGSGRPAQAARRSPGEPVLTRRTTAP